MHLERRRHHRERIALPLQLANGPRGVTRDVSAAGLFLVLQGEHALHGRVAFEMEVAGFSVRFTSRGEIVRVERREGLTGVAVHLTDGRLDAAPADGDFVLGHRGLVLPKSREPDHGQGETGSQ